MTKFWSCAHGWMSLPTHSWIITLIYTLPFSESTSSTNANHVGKSSPSGARVSPATVLSSCNMSDLSTSYKLQPFLLLSKSVKGSANAKLISDALAAPGVYVFSELAQAPNVLEVCYKLPFNCITNLTVLLDRHRRFPK